MIGRDNGVLLCWLQIKRWTKEVWYGKNIAVEGVFVIENPIRSIRPDEDRIFIARRYSDEASPTRSES